MPLVKLEWRVPKHKALYISIHLLKNKIKTLINYLFPLHICG